MSIILQVAVPCVAAILVVVLNSKHITSHLSQLLKGSKHIRLKTYSILVIFLNRAQNISHRYSSHLSQQGSKHITECALHTCFDTFLLAFVTITVNITVTITVLELSHHCNDHVT